jgi:glycosyltransferase involved in cell wall biosynthesis
MCAAAAAVAKIATQQRATVLHANSVRSGLIAGLAKTLSGTPVVVHVRDVLPGGFAASAVKLAVQTRSDALIAVSDYVKRRFGDRGSIMTVIDNPVDLVRFDSEAYDALHARQSVGVYSDCPLIGLVGQITPWKGHETAIRALGSVRDRHPGAKLIVAGEVKFTAVGTSLDNRGYLTRLYGLVENLHLEDAVVFLGERDDIPRVLRALDILLVPSTVEPFGRTVAEAMAMGTPVIATREGGPSELIEHGTTGLLASPGDYRPWAAAIDRLLTDRRAALAMGRAAHAVAIDRFGAARHARSVTAVLERAGRGSD